MMKTWRERVIDARARGHFIPEDYAAWQNIRTCPAAEAVQNLCSFEQVIPNTWESVWMIGDQIGGPLGVNNFPEVERLLDLVEDEALRIKRSL